MNKKRLITTPLKMFTIIALCYTAFQAVSIYQYGNEDQKQTADTAIILGASVTGDNPSPVFRERINHGIWLYQNGYVKTLIFTGGYSAGNSRSDADIAKTYAIEQGVPTSDIYIEERSVITQENLIYAKELMSEHNLTDAIIVSDPLHMKRSMLMAKDLGITAYASPTPTTRYTGIQTKAQFLAREVFFYIGYQLSRHIM